MLDTLNRNQSDFTWLTRPLSSVKPAAALRKIRPILEATWRWRFPAPALLAAVAAVWYFGVPFSFGPLVYVQPVLRAEFVQAVVALAQARATLLNAQHVYERAAELARKGVATKATLDEATRALNVARAQVRSAEFQVFTNQPGGSDYVMAETQLNQARANLTTAQSRLSYTIIKAPRDGVLIWRDVERGNLVQPTTFS